MERQVVIPGETWEEFLDDILRICDVPPELYESFRAKYRLAAEQKINSGRFAQRVGEQYWDNQAKLARKNGIANRKNMKEAQGSLETLSSEEGQQNSTDNQLDDQKQETPKVSSDEDGQQGPTDSQSDGQGSFDSKENTDRIMKAAAHMLNVLGQSIPKHSVGGKPPGFFMGLKPVRAPLLYPQSCKVKLDKLSSLLERDESPNDGVRSDLDTIMSSPVVPHKMNGIEIASQGETVKLKTPTTTGRLYPSLEEMHPSKVQQSTTKQPDSALRLGFVDIGAYTEPGRFKTGLGIGQDTPSRPKVVNAKLPSSPGFDFKFTRRGPELGPEAQKMMDDLREEALRIKAQLAVERQQDQGKDATSEEENVFGGSAAGRKIAKPKGKVGRFSEVHMAEFKKMDSIAGHPSAYRLQQSAAIQPSMKTTSLKRSKSQAKLDEPDHSVNAATPIKKAQHDHSDIKNSAKRMKQHMEADTSSARPISQEQPNPNGMGSKPSTPGLTRSKSGVLPSVVITPTKASLARSASVKDPSKTMIPSISQSPSTRTPGGAGLRSEGSNKHLSSLGNLSRMKSILRRPRLFSAATTENNEIKTDTTTVTTPTPKANLDKDLPSLPPSTDHRQHHPTSSAVKRVNFTPNTKTGGGVDSKTSNLLSAVPSPIKTLVQESPSKSSLPTLKSPTLTQITQPNRRTGGFDFTFTSLSPSKGPIKFSNTGTTGPTTPTSSSTTPNKPSTIRYVRPSLGPQNNTHLSLPDVSGVIPHGMPNKKKRRHESNADSDSDEENREPNPKRQHIGGGGIGDKEKQDGMMMSSSSSRLPSAVKRAGQQAEGKNKKKRGVLSAARLNILARPKQR